MLLGELVNVMHVTARKAWPAKLYLSSFEHLIGKSSTFPNPQLRLDSHLVTLRKL